MLVYQLREGDMDSVSCVCFVGAGPGDPDLMTIKALRLIQEAEVIVYDRLVSKEIMGLVPKGVARIYVGKSAGNHHMTQDEINNLLVRLGKTGRKIVRLKGGDPFIFGRGGEEALHLRQHGIPFEVVPGVTSAAACSTYAGIPLTHRGLATGARIVTGHCRANVPLNLNWQSLADPDTTLVVYMGLAHLEEISSNLMEAGLPPDTPAAAIENGTTPRHRRCIDTLSGLVSRVRELDFRTPSLIIIGHVVSLADELEWFQPVQAELSGEDNIRLLRADG